MSSCSENIDGGSLLIDPVHDPVLVGEAHRPIPLELTDKFLSLIGIHRDLVVQDVPKFGSEFGR